MAEVLWFVRWLAVLILVGVGIGFLGPVHVAAGFVIGLLGGALNVWYAWRQLRRASNRQNVTEAVRIVQQGTLLRFATVIALVWFEQRLWPGPSVFAVLVGLILPWLLFTWHLTHSSDASGT